MKEYLAELTHAGPTPAHGRNVAREYLQARVLAMLQRSYVKGRDVYDLLWFLSDPDWPPPNPTMLNNALQQTGWPGGVLTEDNWRAVVRRRLQAGAWERIGADVRPLLEPSADGAILTRENLLRVLG
jgi:hypothetical protein